MGTNGSVVFIYKRLYIQYWAYNSITCMLLYASTVYIHLVHTQNDYIWLHVQYSYKRNTS